MILQSTVWSHQSTARPLERVASHIKGTPPPCLFQLPPLGNVNRSTTLIQFSVCECRYIINSSWQKLHDFVDAVFPTLNHLCSPVSTDSPIQYEPSRSCRIVNATCWGWGCWTVRKDCNWLGMARSCLRTQNCGLMTGKVSSWHPMVIQLPLNLLLSNRVMFRSLINQARGVPLALQMKFAQPWFSLWTAGGITIVGLTVQQT